MLAHNYMYIHECYVASVMHFNEDGYLFQWLYFSLLLCTLVFLSDTNSDLFLLGTIVVISPSIALSFTVVTVGHVLFLSQDLVIPHPTCILYSSPLLSLSPVWMEFCLPCLHGSALQCLAIFCIGFGYCMVLALYVWHVVQYMHAASWKFLLRGGAPSCVWRSIAALLVFYLAVVLLNFGRGGGPILQMNIASDIY